MGRIVERAAPVAWALALVALMVLLAAVAFQCGRPAPAPPDPLHPSAPVPDPDPYRLPDVLRGS